MRATTKLISILIITLFAMVPIVLVDAKPALSVSLYRDWGYGMGNDIAGLLTLKTATSDNVSYVEFYLDNQLTENATSAPFNWQFNTNNYTLGEHTLKAVAYDNSGESQTSSITRNFVVDNTMSTLIIGVVVAVVVTAVAVVIAVYRIKKGKK